MALKNSAALAGVLNGTLLPGGASEGWLQSLLFNLGKFLAGHDDYAKMRRRCVRADKRWMKVFGERGMLGGEGVGDPTLFLQY